MIRHSRPQRWSSRLIDRWSGIEWELRLRVLESGQVAELVALATVKDKHGPKLLGSSHCPVGPFDNLHELCVQAMVEAATNAEHPKLPGVS